MSAAKEDHVATEMALTKPDASLDRDTLRTQMDAAMRYVQSGLLPSSIKTPQQALVIMQVGREIGVPPTYALRNIHVVNGRPVISAELLMALIRRTYGAASIRVAKTSSEACVIQYREQGWDGVSEYEFNLEDAKRAGLLGKGGPWQQYPAAMLRARAISAVARMAFPEAIAGLYTPEEMGAEVVVTESGEVEIAEPERPPLTVVETPHVVEAVAVEDDTTALVEHALGLVARAAQLQVPNHEAMARTDFRAMARPQLIKAIAKIERAIALVGEGDDDDRGAAS